MNFPDANRIDVEEVARVSAAVERAELVAHGVLETEYRADGQHSRLGLAPVHAHVNVDLMAVGSCHFKASELVDAAQLRDVVAGLAQAKHNGVDGGRKARQVDIGREQVDVLGWAVDEAVLADGTGPASTKLVPSRDRRATRVISRCGSSASLTPLLPVRGTGSPTDSGRGWTRSTRATIREEVSG